MSKKNKSVEELKGPQGYVLGALPPKIDIRNYQAVATVTADDIEIPESFELNIPHKIKNQGIVGSCVGHALSEIVEYFNYIQEEKYEEFSTGYIYGNRRCGTRYQGVGMYEQEALQSVLKWGDVPTDLFNYNVEVPEAITKFEDAAFDLAPSAYPNRFSGYYQINSERDAKLNLMQHGPLLIGTRWYNDYAPDPETFIMKHTTNAASGNHALMIYGWNKDGWLIQNSWGAYWGNQGCAIMPYEDKWSECYGIIDEISERQRQHELIELKRTIIKYEVAIEELKKEQGNLNENIEKLQQNLKLSNDQLLKIQEEIDALTKEFTELEADAPNSEKYNEIKNLLRNRKEAEDELKAIITKQEKILADDQEALKLLIKKVQDHNKEMEEKDAQIKALENELLEIEKPYKNMPKWLALIINAILNVFKKSE